MMHASYRRLLRTLPPAARKGPVALMLVQDEIGLAESMAWLRAAGIGFVITLGDETAAGRCGADACAPFDCHRPGAMAAAANALIRAVPGAWVLPLWNGERPVWPHGDTRPLPDLLAFLEDERRAVLGGVVLDAYPRAEGGWAVDRIGYDRRGTAIHGGLRERIGPPCPAAGRRIDRPLALKARPGLRLGVDGFTGDPELDAPHGPWHHSPTAALVSPRVWAWLAAQPEHDLRTLPLIWSGSAPLSGRAAQLWDMGMIEPGQWV